MSIQVAKDLWTLEFLVEKYKLKYGSLPGNLHELVRGQSRKYQLADPLGTPYQYDSGTGAVRLSPESKVQYLKVPESYRDELRMTG